MRTLKAIFLLAFVSGFFSSLSISAQVDISKNENFELTLSGSTGTYQLTGVEVIKITPSGNLTRIVTFKVEPDNPIMDLASPVAFFRVTATGDFDGDGVTEILVDDFAVLTKSGNLKLVYHLIGSKK